eukprot:CAMPEP_0177642430 /NCGR_PEP_ID=MMETSP0447-20121125/7582_1 /TAXON_ID=0 /ORGANISM="Stygamoeba regulata, Strain BSH-02190019" /LENGTH=162 /DNA_ID=CAMNT_0019144587 /DNA_START=295 /DNA_END=780 /DNA_ORIENTATION=+
MSDVETPAPAAVQAPVETKDNKQQEKEDTTAQAADKGKENVGDSAQPAPSVWQKTPTTAPEPAAASGAAKPPAQRKDDSMDLGSWPTPEEAVVACNKDEPDDGKGDKGDDRKGGKGRGKKKGTHWVPFKDIGGAVATQRPQRPRRCEPHDGCSAARGPPHKL